MLKRVGRNLSTLPLRYLGGVPGDARAMWGRADRVNQSIGEGINNKTAGQPYGHLAPSSWNLPIKPGAMASRNTAGAVLTVNPLNLAAGRNLSGNAAAVLTVTGSGAAVASLSGTAAAVLVTSGALSAPFNMVGNAPCTLTTSATLRANAFISGASNSVLTTGLVTYAIAHLEGSTAGGGLTADSIAEAVWGSLTSSYTVTGTMGKALADAGGAGNPWASLTADNDDPGTFGELVSVIYTLADELHTIQGLGFGKPMTVTAVNRVAGDITLNLTGDGSTTTTVTRA